MRRIISITHITLDGVIQSNGGPAEEDSVNDFKYSGWTMPYQSDSSGAFFTDLLGRGFDLLLGRKTYDFFGSYWPTQHGFMFADTFNAATKYVASRSPQALPWEHSVQVEGDAIDGIRKLKETDGPELHIWGSANLMQGLMTTDLVDQMIFITYPLILGNGKRLFDGNSMASCFSLTQTTTTDTGVVIATYERAGDVPVS